MRNSSDTKANAVTLLTRINNFWRSVPIVFQSLVLLLSIEFLVAVVAPILIPDNLYLKMYLPETSIENHKVFLRGEAEFLMYDEFTGWRNRPKSGQGTWLLDEHGARSTHSFSIKRDGRTRVLFLGNSLVNGGVHVSSGQTISAMIEDSLTESLNFATMLYSIDQSLLAYKHDLHRYNSDIVVVGISGSPLDGLRNQYIPFRSRQETNMPYLKPRFEIRSNKLQIVPVPSIELCRELLMNTTLLDNLANTDDYYSEFGLYKRFGFLPISGSVWKIFKKAQNFSKLIRGDFKGLLLLTSIMDSIVKEAEGHGAAVIFVILPDRQTTAPSGWRRYLPDNYLQLVDELRETGFNIVDARESLRQSKYPIRNLYSPDNIHYSPVGNSVIAPEIRARINSLMQIDSQ